MKHVRVTVRAVLVLAYAEKQSPECSAIVGTQSIDSARRAAPGRRQIRGPIVRVTGTVTMETGTMPEFPGTFYMQDVSGGISVSAPEGTELATGTRVTICGPLYLADATEPEILAQGIERLEGKQELAPRVSTPQEVASGALDGVLVRIQGTVSRLNVGETRDVLFLDMRPNDLRVYFRRGRLVQSTFARVAQPGSLVDVVGIAVPNGGGHQLRMRQASDLTMLRAPSQFSERHALYLVGGLAAIFVVVGSWVWTLRRSIRSQTSQIQTLLEDARESSRLKSQFLATMSHEIRTPMNGILGMQTLLLGTELNEEQKAYLSDAQNCTVSLLNLLNDVLDLSRAESGRLELTSEPFVLRQLVEEAVSTVRGQARQKGISVSWTAGDGVPGRVQGDSLRLRQVLLNLLSNALKFTAAGAVDVAVHVARSDGKSVVLQFAVRDTGIGIPAEQQKLIFDVFRQADGSISRKYGGTGLGLAISRQLVTLMGGDLSLFSTPGDGSVFSFTWPAEVAEAEERLTSDQAPIPEASGKRLLVVEDNRVNRLIAERLLVKAGYSVEVADGGESAIERLTAERFDAVLMDVQMPGMNGLQATQRLRELEAEAAWPRTRVLALTALAMPGDAQACLAAGMDGFVAKPFKVEALIEAIEAPQAQPIPAGARQAR